MIRIKLPRPSPGHIIKQTHGKKGRDVAAVCSPQFHVLVREDVELFTTLAENVKTQNDHDGFPLMAIGQCRLCGTSMARVLSDEARMRLEEMPDETEARHARS